MSGFDIDWLDQREPADTRSRSTLVEKALVAWREQHQALHVVDLGAGTGSNLRHLVTRLGGEQSWRLLDNDENLLSSANDRTEAWAARAGFVCRHHDDALHVTGDHLSFTQSVKTAELGSDLGPARLSNIDLVTGSALLDLVSYDWLRLLIERCGAGHHAALFALTYDGRMSFAPAHPDDRQLVAAVNRHQRGEKGFGRALGPDAADVARDLFVAAGYKVVTGDSTWQLGSSDSAMQAMLIDDWARASAEVGERVDDWRAWRQTRVADDGSALKVGHVDLFAWP